MIFTHDTDVVLQHTAALLNTAPGHGTGEVEDLTDLAALLDWMEAWQWTGARPTTEADTAAVRSLRPRLRRLWTAPLAEQVQEVNALLEEGDATPRLVEHDAFGWHVHATRDDAPFTQRVTVEVAMAMIDVLRSEERDRLSVCSGEDCEDVYVDLSRNRSRKFCDGTCGTRANVAAYRARKAADAPHSDQ